MVDKGEGLRFNEGKTRHDLLEPFAIEELAKVFTKGAEKYEPGNWLKGMNWSKVIASLKRHINKFEQGEDFDEETGLYHMAQAAWNALAIVSYYKYFPQGDDRMINKIKKPTYTLDIDDVCCDFVGEYCKLYNMPIPTDFNFDPLIKSRLEKMHENNTLDDFSLQLPELIHGSELPFTPVAYVTARGERSKKVTEEWLKLKEFPLAPVFCTGYKSKLEVLKSIGADIHIDDSYFTFKELNDNGICCFLFDANHNRKYDVGYKRIFSLKDLK